jgi:hypothetical protein
MPIEPQAPGLEHIVHLDQQIEALVSGFGGDRRTIITIGLPAHAIRTKPQ